MKIERSDHSRLISLLLFAFHNQQNPSTVENSFGLPDAKKKKLTIDVTSTCFAVINLEVANCMTRIDFAERISSGLAGWLQQLAAQNLEHQVGEDAARVELVRMISAQQAYVPDTSVRPTNWPENTKKRVDVAVRGRQKLAAGGWHGAIELKWPNLSIDLKATRHAIVEDAVRVAFSDISNLCANFVILGGTTSALANLFDKQHSNKTVEQQRVEFNNLFSRDETSKSGLLSNAGLCANFPDFGDRVPQTVFNGWSRRLKTNLVAVSMAKVGSTPKGYVYIWQVFK